MKNFLIILLVILILGIGAYFGWSYFKGKDEVIQVSKNKEFIWGVSMYPFAADHVYIQKNWISQLALAKNLNVDYVRIKWDDAAYTDPKANLEFHDKFLKEIFNQKLGLYLILEPDQDLKKMDNAYEEGYQTASRVASFYKGKIDYYQLMNESASNAIKGPQYSGEKESDYDPVLYPIVRDWIKGASAAIEKEDPSAKRVVTDQWTHYAFFDMLEKDGIDYDVLGWDWFSDMGLMGDKKLSSGQTILEKLQSFGKPVILAEVNARPNKNGQDEEKQSNYIQAMADWAKQQKLAGFFVHVLTDATSRDFKTVDRYGLVKIEKNEKERFIIGTPRKAYQTYKEIIEKYK